MHPKDNNATEETKRNEEMAQPNKGNGSPTEEHNEAGVSEEDVLLRLTRENEELKERVLRLAAEMENLRKRTQRDVADARAFGITNFARDMLAISDDLQRALQAVDQEAREQGGPVLKALVEGVEMTERSMKAALERHGVRSIDADGKFDPHLHQAMFEVENPDVPAGMVVQVVQEGYTIGERVLRPSMVGVSKGGPKEPKATAAPSENDTENPA